MERIHISDKTNFIGCWNLKDENLCNNIIDFFENNKQSHAKGVLGKAGEVDESRKKSIDMNIIPKDLNKDEFKCLKDYMHKLFDCYQDYKKIWPFLNKTFPVVDVPSFNIQKYEKGGHFGSMHCERDSIAVMYRVFAWMTYLNSVDDGGETYFENFDLKIKPEAGKTLIWPAEWTHSHRGETLKSGLKYIVTGWMIFPFKFHVPQKV